MKHFLKIAENIDVAGLKLELALNRDLWDANTLRTLFPDSPHAATSDIWIAFNQVDPENPQAVANDLQVRFYEAWARLPTLRPLILGLMHRVQGVQLGRVLITRLPPGGTIPPHRDQGAPAEFYRRFQIALQCAPGCLFRIEDEVVQFRPGEAWWIDNRAEHSVVNNSAEDRLALVVDVRCA